jgi:glycogen debranching enzyme
VPLPIQVGPSTVTINRDDRFLVCLPDGRVQPEAEHGLFARDTRFVSGWDLRVNGVRPVLLNSSQIEFYSSRFEFTNDPFSDDMGPVERQTLSIRVDRTIWGGIHEDLDIVNYGRRQVRLTIEVEVGSDFADVFDVRSGDLVRRGQINSRWLRSRRELRTSYVNRDFRRELVLAVDRPDSPPQYANGQLVFVATIEPKAIWHTCLRWLPLIDGGRRPPTLECHAIEGPLLEAGRQRLPAVRLEAAEPWVVGAWDQAVRDLEALRLEDGAAGRGVITPASGVPWYVALFGRDSLMVSMQGITGFPEFAAGALRRLSQLQATESDPQRDMEPGKILHELRHGELARLGILPYQPYYGTHDATSLFILALYWLYQWSGAEELLERYLPNATAAMRWIDRHGDRDGDRLQEYMTRSRHGYYNQGWKDSGDAIQHADGSLAPLPLALCEIQGYAYDAKVRLAAIHEVLGNREAAGRLHAEAGRLYELVNDRFWWDREGTYYLGLDGQKRPIRTVASNAGHLLWSGIVPPDRARRVVKRLLADDMWSGWGIRTLSSDHPGYNPFSYHNGSVWPHDNAIIVDGFRRYGFHSHAAHVSRAMFDTARRFQANRLPELFAGLPRQAGSFPVQYLGANVPQAWAAGAIIRLVAILTGIEARSHRGGSRIHVDPLLPDWLPSVTISNLRAGRGSLSLRIDDGTFEVLDNTTGFDIVAGPAPGAWPDDPRHGVRTANMRNSATTPAR